MVLIASFVPVAQVGVVAEIGEVASIAMVGLVTIIGRDGFVTSVAQSEQPEPLRADSDEIVLSVVMTLDTLQDRSAPCCVEFGHPVDAGFPAVADRDHAKLPRLRPGQQVSD